MKTSKNWSGYDIEQIRIMRATNALRIDMEKQRLAILTGIASPANGSQPSNKSIYDKIGSIAEAIEVGLKTYRVVRKVANLFHKQKK